MTRFWFTMALLAVALPTAAAENSNWDPIPANEGSGWFISSQSKSVEQFDLWQIDSGYAYALGKKTELYLSTRLKSGNEFQGATRGLLSGVKYNFSPKLSLQSAVTSESVNEETVVGVEVSSQYEVIDRVNLHATVDYESLEQIYQVGIGFRF
ncbi:hypothetical protein [Photobacterium sp. TY1-4]|uniref:hypothetical protein n=1 Tax=Photobacterium sp. TY1-4 TaxID=2899122 RepID=UPI0021BF442F|nr:hypothetical protein [Photobacterium sp. TY1-4]UXI00870.1 hypothetical protein NH461_13855 [Photobacterium sp. TY1-4]